MDKVDIVSRSGVAGVYKESFSIPFLEPLTAWKLAASCLTSARNTMEYLHLGQKNQGNSIEQTFWALSHWQTSHVGVPGAWDGTVHTVKLWLFRSFQDFPVLSTSAPRLKYVKWLDLVDPHGMVLVDSPCGGFRKRDMTWSILESNISAAFVAQYVLFHGSSQRSKWLCGWWCETKVPAGFGTGNPWLVTPCFHGIFLVQASEPVSQWAYSLPVENQANWQVLGVR